MRHALMMIAAVGLLGIAASPASAAATPPYKLNSAGKCIGANGQFAKADLCKAPAKPAAAKPTKCKDPKTKKFTKCTVPGAVPA